MTMPSDSQLGDPTAVILARMEVKLDNALTEQSRHTTTLDRHDSILGEHGNRITALETAGTTTTSGRANLWAAYSAVASIAAVVLAVLLAVRGG